MWLYKIVLGFFQFSIFSCYGSVKTKNFREVVILKPVNDTLKKRNIIKNIYIFAANVLRYMICILCRLIMLRTKMTVRS